jgi:hypothetical protein
MIRFPGGKAMTPFDRWYEEMQALLIWHGIDPAKVAREDLWHMFRRGDAAIEAARFIANGARREQEAWVAQRTLSRTPVTRV